MIPCHGCILLPVCNSKESITCTKLRNHYGDVIDKADPWEDSAVVRRQLWNKIHVYLPNVVGIKSDESQMPPGLVK